MNSTTRSLWLKRKIAKLIDWSHRWEIDAGIAALRNRRVLAAQLRSSDNAVVGVSLLIER